MVGNLCFNNHVLKLSCSKTKKIIYHQKVSADLLKISSRFQLRKFWYNQTNPDSGYQHGGAVIRESVLLLVDLGSISLSSLMKAFKNCFGCFPARRFA